MSNTVFASGSADRVLLVNTSGVPVNPPSGPVSSTVTAGYTSVTGAFTIASGAAGFTIANVGSASGTVGGVALASGTTIGWDVVPGATYNALSGDATGTNFLIAKTT